MGSWGDRIVALLLKATEGRISFQLVLAASVALFWVSFAIFVFMVSWRLYLHLRFLYRSRRRRLYDPAIEKVLMEEPLADVIAALRPRRWGDLSVVQEVIVDNMRYLKGPPFETLHAAAQSLGLIEFNLARLKSRGKYIRGNAMEALGVMRAPQAVVGIIDILAHEPMDMKLVALRALAAIGNPAVLPYFVKAADRLPPPMLPRLASLMLEFGAPARHWIGELINRHREAFPPRVIQEVLKETAADALRENAS